MKTIDALEEVRDEIERELRYPTDGDICYSEGLQFAWGVINRKLLSVISESEDKE